MEDPTNFTDTPIFKMACNNIQFEIKTQILTKYNYTISDNCDFTANNLMMDMNGKIVVRAPCQYDYITICQHVYDRKLFPIYRFTFSEQHPLTIKARTILEQRQLKMIGAGYS